MMIMMTTTNEGASMGMQAQAAEQDVGLPAQGFMRLDHLKHDRTSC